MPAPTPITVMVAAAPLICTKNWRRLICVACGSVSPLYWAYTHPSASPHAMNSAMINTALTKPSACSTNADSERREALISAKNKPSTAPAAPPSMPACSAGMRRSATNTSAPARMPMPTTNTTPCTCSNILAVLDVSPRLKAWMKSIIRLMPKRITSPGKTRANQSKKSKGIKGRFCHCSPTKEMAINGAMNTPPNKAPSNHPARDDCVFTSSTISPLKINVS